jgi:flavodoxin/ferredoxin
MSREHAIRWRWLKGMYVYTMLGAGSAGIGILVAPDLTRSMLGLPPQDQLISFGVTGSVYLAFALVSILGLRDPLAYAPILLLQLVYKTVWVGAVVIPRILAGTLPGHASLPLAIYGTFILGDVVALPFAWLFSARARVASARVEPARATPPRDAGEGDGSTAGEPRAKRALIVYLSQRGTNARVAELVAGALRDAGHRVDLWNLKQGQPPPAQDYDVLGVGSPTYYFRAPFLVTDYVRGIGDLAGRPAFVFVVHGAYRGNTGNTIRRALRQNGAKEIGFFACYGADFFLGYLKQGWLLSPDHPTARELEGASAFGRDVVARLAGAPYAPPPEDPPAHWMYRLERFLGNRWIVRHVYSRAFTVSAACRPACDVCIRQCPVQNIRRGERGELIWGRDCLMCLSCEMNCPEDAITSAVSRAIFRPFIAYNVRMALRDPALDSAPVKHERGATTRL